MIKKIARDWRVKMAAQKAIGLLPSRLAFPLNDRMVGLATGNRSARIDTIWRANKCLENVSLVREAGAWRTDTLDSVLEMGTGWHGIDLIVLHLLGGREIVTVDHWPHLKGEELFEQIKKMEGRFSDLHLDGWVDPSIARQRLSQLRGEAGNPSLQGILGRVNNHRL